METAGLQPLQIILCFLSLALQQKFEKNLLLQAIFIEKFMRLPHLMSQLIFSKHV